MGILFLMTCVRDWHYRSCMHIVLGVLAGHLSQKQPLRSQLLFRVFTELLNKNIATYIFLMVQACCRLQSSRYENFQTLYSFCSQNLANLREDACFSIFLLFKGYFYSLVLCTHIYYLIHNTTPILLFLRQDCMVPKLALNLCVVDHLPPPPKFWIFRSCTAILR